MQLRQRASVHWRSSDKQTNNVIAECLNGFKAKYRNIVGHCTEWGSVVHTAHTGALDILALNSVSWP